MGGGPVIIIDPNGQVRSTMSIEDTIEALRQRADQLEIGAADLEVMNEPADDEE